MPEITLSNPVDSSGNLTLVQGDDYATADGRAPEWTLPSTDIELDSGWNISLMIGAAGPFTGAVTEAVTDEFTIQVPLTAAQTALLWPNTRTRYYLQAEQSATDGRLITLTSGVARIRRPAGFEVAST